MEESAVAEQAPPDQAHGEISPDQLDRLLTLIRPSAWLVLGALLVLVGLTVVWGFVGTVRQTVDGAGIIQRSAGLRVVQTPAAGQVTRVDVAVGDTVGAGDALATIKAPNGTQTTVRSPIAARVVDVAVDAQTVVAVGARLLRIEPSGGSLQATVAVAAADRGELAAGDAVQDKPTSVVDAELGYVKGQVAQIAPYPADQDELQRAFGSEQLVAQIAHSAPVYLVSVRLQTDAATDSGLAWSSRAGASATVDAGQLADATVIVSEQSLVQQIFP
jgi:multidrug efflux pump subunit AcrA (membrane-fusion protein)